MAVGLDVAAEQADFSAGMFRGIREDLIPRNGCFDITNGLLDNTGAIYRRGGTSYRSSSPFGATTLPFIWDGFLGTGSTLQRTVIGHATAFGLMNADGTITSLGGTGISVPRRAAVINGVLYLPGGTTYNGATLGTATKTSDYYAVAGNRLFAATAPDQIDFSDINAPTTYSATDFHRMPDGVQIIGLQGLRDALMVFTTGGVWIISNLGFDLTDASGNVQHRIDRYSSDMVLWGDAGIAAYEGGLVVPALDGVWVVSLGVASEAPQAFRRISDPIVGLYHDYVKNGYSPGGATVYNGHYLLPILSGTTCVDVLVCRLDAPGQPWTHLQGFGAKIATFAVRKSATVPRAPALIGSSAAGPRVLNLSYFEPPGVSTLDADGSVFAWSMRTRDYATGPRNKNTITGVRIFYELADDAVAGAPTIRLLRHSGTSGTGVTEWGRFDWGQADWSGTSSAVLVNGEAPVDPFAENPYRWWFAKDERFGRFTLELPVSAAYLTLRSFEMFVRSNGRRL